MKCGMTKDQLDSCVGIHPTIGEELTGLTKTKEKDGDNVEKGGCWGWTHATCKYQGWGQTNLGICVFEFNIKTWTYSCNL